MVEANQTLATDAFFDCCGLSKGHSAGVKTLKYVNKSEKLVVASHAFSLQWREGCSFIVGLKAWSIAFVCKYALQEGNCCGNARSAGRRRSSS